MVLLDSKNFVDLLGTPSPVKELVRCRSRISICAPYVRKWNICYHGVRYTYLSSGDYCHGICSNSHSNLSSVGDDATGNWRE